MSISVDDAIEASKSERVKKSWIAKVSEALMILTLLGGLGFFVYDDGFHKFLQFLIVPGIFLFISIIYNLPIIGSHVASTIAFLNSIGINGIPAIALTLLVIIGILNITNGDKLLSDILKLVSGFTTGSFAQKAAASVKSKKQSKNAKDN